MRNKLFSFLACCFGVLVSAQQSDSIFVAADSIAIDTTNTTIPVNIILSAAALDPFYAKLAALEQTNIGKVNIVHIGDSHIQADLMTAKTRRELQQIFGNGGRGFVFPHNLAKTNGSSDIKFSSNGRWESHRNIYPPNGSAVGLSGISLESKSSDIAIEINAKEADNHFNRIRIITPNNARLFDVATARETISLETNVPKNITHRIRSGEALSIIADKYIVSIAAIKKLNNLKSNTIRAGKTLRIPSRELETVKTERTKFIPLPILSDSLSHYYSSDALLDKIYLISAPAIVNPALNGVVLENNNSGIVYHNIGVNGAKFSDYNKYPLFFEQLKALTPDLIIVSLGTNESFDKLTTDEYLVQLNLFIQNIRAQNPHASLLVLTPPPSLFQRKNPNTFAAAYAKSIVEMTGSSFATFDLFSQLGGLPGIQTSARNGIIGGDRVHYTKAGYELQGMMLTEALLNGFSEYKLMRR